MNSAPPPAVKGEPDVTDNPPLLLMAKAETVPEPELLTNAKAVVCRGAAGELPIMPLQPLRIIKPENSNAENSRSNATRGRANEVRAGELIGESPQLGGNATKIICLSTQACCLGMSSLGELGAVSNSLISLLVRVDCGYCFLK